eukprot:CAMPEP_0118683424 /NCGR_PEP_ID=MMETSP0800-20121206/6038_1 /TAXON_ID=210618 ORGANISM="Striatella unipunctata, Strain CCMP2910" /NCGR_SAMPLE_ID=MMETSP0800 /ASSEMBLY_ACC=CAM_ASM_000638 /LENGTH=75 /DNA_ID=CAMNT_0006579933 /DNA_START=115 /DNA_END=339 /DNA_ORIENTATION=-
MYQHKYMTNQQWSKMFNNRIKVIEHVGSRIEAKPKQATAAEKRYMTERGYVDDDEVDYSEVERCKEDARNRHLGV